VLDVQVDDGSTHERPQLGPHRHAQNFDSLLLHVLAGYVPEPHGGHCLESQIPRQQLNLERVDAIILGVEVCTVRVGLIGLVHGLPGLLPVDVVAAC